MAVPAAASAVKSQCHFSLTAALSPIRTCVVTRAKFPSELMIRLRPTRPSIESTEMVAAPDSWIENTAGRGTGKSNKAPAGRGCWVLADSTALESLKSSHLTRALRGPVKVPDNIIELTQTLARRDVHVALKASVSSRRLIPFALPSHDEDSEEHDLPPHQTTTNPSTPVSLNQSALHRLATVPSFAFQPIKPLGYLPDALRNQSPPHHPQLCPSVGWPAFILSPTSNRSSFMGVPIVKSFSEVDQQGLELIGSMFHDQAHRDPGSFSGPLSPSRLAAIEYDQQAAEFISDPAINAVLMIGPYSRAASKLWNALRRWEGIVHGAPWANPSREGAASQRSKSPPSSSPASSQSTSWSSSTSHFSPPLDINKLQL